MESGDVDDVPLVPEQPASSSVPAETTAPATSVARAGDMTLLGVNRGEQRGNGRGGASQRPDCSKKQTPCCKKPVSAVLKKVERRLQGRTLGIPIPSSEVTSSMPEKSAVHRRGATGVSSLAERVLELLAS